MSGKVSKSCSDPAKSEFIGVATRIMKTPIFAFLFSASLAVAGKPIAFQQLPAGDSIHVTFTSTGCWHYVAYEFDFQRAGTFTVKVTEVEHRWNEAQQCPEEVKRIPLGTVTLSEVEIAGLDRLFAFYRSKKSGGCTTVDRITATQRSGDAVQATESFTDATCATYDMKSLTRLTSIAVKLKPKTR